MLRSYSDFIRLWGTIGAVFRLALSSRGLRTLVKVSLGCAISRVSFQNEDQSSQRSLKSNIMEGVRSTHFESSNKLFELGFSWGLCKWGLDMLFILSPRSCFPLSFPCPYVLLRSIQHEKLLLNGFGPCPCLFRLLGSQWDVGDTGRQRETEREGERPATKHLNNWDLRWDKGPKFLLSRARRFFIHCFERQQRVIRNLDGGSPQDFVDN